MHYKRDNKCDNIISDCEGVNIVGISREMVYRQIGAKVAYYRTLNDLDQKQLAKKVHISQSTLSRIEGGRYGDNISIAMLLDIAEGLNIDPTLLTTFSETEKEMWQQKIE